MFRLVGVCVFFFASSLATDEHCYEALDVVQLQDISTSAEPAWDSITKQIHQTVKMVAETSCHSRFGFATFSDKNLSKPDEETKCKVDGTNVGRAANQVIVTGLNSQLGFTTCGKRMSGYHPWEKALSMIAATSLSFRVDLILSHDGEISSAHPDNTTVTQCNRTAAEKEGTVLGVSKTVLGFPEDYCLRVDMTLDTPNSTDAENMLSAIKKHAAGGGGDWPEAVFEGIYRCMQAGKVEWRDFIEEPTERVMKILVVPLNTVSHLSGDVKRLTGVPVDPFSLSEEDLKEEENFKCDKTDYPQASQIAELAQKKDFRVILLAAPDGKCNRTEEGFEFEPTQAIAAKGEQYRKENGLALWYNDTLRDAGLNDDRLYVQQLDCNMTDYARAFEKGLNFFKRRMCPLASPNSDAIFPTALL